MTHTSNETVGLLHRRGFGGKHAAVKPGDEQLPPHLRSDPPAGVESARSELASRLMNPRTGRSLWVFMVGGPGNGKSHQLGELLSGIGAPLPPHGALASRALPELNEPGGSFRAINDATIRPVPTPIGGHLAHELLDTLSRSKRKPSHLWVNINRGVLIEERALAAREASDARAAQILDWLLGRGGSPEHIDDASDHSVGSHVRRAVLDGHIDLYAIALDQVSLLQGTRADGSPDPLSGLGEQLGVSPAKRLLENLVSPARFEDAGCAECVARRLCPFLANAQTIRGRAGAGLLTLCRASEVATGQLLSYRDLWAVFATAILGRGIEAFSSAGGPCGWSIEASTKVESNDADPEPVVSLQLQRLQYAMFRMEVPSPFLGRRYRQSAVGASASVDRLSIVDPAIDAGSGWATSVTDALSGAALGRSPLERLGAVGGALHGAVTEIDLEFERRILDFGVVGAGARAIHMRVLGLGLYRLAGMLGAHVAFRRELEEMLDLARLAQVGENPATPLANAIRRVVLGTGTELLLPLIAPRVHVHEIPAGTIVARVAYSGPNAPQVLFRSEGTHVSACLPFGDREDHEVRVPVDLSLAREALARDGQGGFTEASASTSPRIERFRAALLSPRAPTLPVAMHEPAQVL